MQSHFQQPNVGSFGGGGGGGAAAGGDGGGGGGENADEEADLAAAIAASLSGKPLTAPSWKPAKMRSPWMQRSVTCAHEFCRKLLFGRAS